MVCFTPTISISSLPVAKRQHFGCLALALIFPSCLYQPASAGTLIPLSGKVRRPHKWMLNLRGNMLSHWISGHLSDTFCIGSMAECDTIASRINSSPVQFVDHPALRHIVQPWAGHQRWRPCCKAIKTSVFRGRHHEGELQRDKCMTATDHRVVSHGADLIEWTELRWIRAISSQVMQTIYRLKCNSFPLWNWSIRDRSCPNPEYSPGTYASASHVFWNCPAMQVHWRRLLDLRRVFGEFEDADIYVWVFAFRLPACPWEAWAAEKTRLTANV